MANQDPNKPEIITRTAFGGRSAVALGGNRYSTQSETLFKAANFIAIPSRGFWIDGAMWVSFFAVLFRVPFSLLQSSVVPLYLALILVSGIFVPSFGWLLTVAKVLPDHRPDCVARLAMIVVGLAIATNGFWLRSWL
jgi:hypothetical protein